MQQLALLLWRLFDPGVENFHMLPVQPKQYKTKKPNMRGQWLQKETWLPVSDLVSGFISYFWFKLAQLGTIPPPVSVPASPTIPPFFWFCPLSAPLPLTRLASERESTVKTPRRARLCSPLQLCPCQCLPGSSRHSHPIMRFSSLGCRQSKPVITG